MTQQEFTQRTGLELNEKQYNYVNEMYMRCATLDKDAFCKDYKKHKDSEILDQIMDWATATAEGGRHSAECYFKLQREVAEKNVAMAEFLLGKATAYNDDDLEREALRLVNRPTTILIKAKRGYPFSQEDLDYIAKNLK
jgi:hypothetical protein